MGTITIDIGTLIVFLLFTALSLVAMHGWIQIEKIEKNKN